jgi:ABC-type bacteriocin/lantibiotic exporter with double-glycine peptidase domain
MTEFGLRKIVSSVEGGLPVIVSWKRREGGSPHTVLVVGSGNDSIVIHDPDSRDVSEGKYVTVSREDFLNNWRKFAIFFER